jgi:hypothetical protein
VPVILLGCVSPYAVRLALGASSGAAESGGAAGRIYASSTLGSLVGTFVSPLVLIPWLGVRATYWLLAVSLLLAALLLLWDRASLSLVVGTAGLVSLGAELGANRLLGPAFGDSNLVWAAVIAVNMGALAAGYLIGGWLADRAPVRPALAALLVTAAVMTGLAPLLADSALAVTRGGRRTARPAFCWPSPPRPQSCLHYRWC